MLSDRNRKLVDRVAALAQSVTVESATMNRLLDAARNEALLEVDQTRAQSQPCDAREPISRAVIDAGEPAAWRPISEAHKGETRIWAALHTDIFPRLQPNRPDLALWNGAQVPLRHPGAYERDGRTWDHGWNLAAPVGQGGFPDEWIAGWLPLPVHPSLDALSGAQRSELSTPPGISSKSSNLKPQGQEP